MKTKDCLPALALGAAAALLLRSAHAVTMTPHGAATPADSWFQNFDIVGEDFDTIEIFIVSDAGAGPFEAPGLSNIIDVGGGSTDWTSTVLNPNYTKATGTETFWLNANLNFEGDIDSDLVFDGLF